MIRHIESTESIWLIDGERHVYLRMPKNEQPRLVDPDTEPEPCLADLRWLPYTSWDMNLDRADRLWLNITIPDEQSGTVIHVQVVPPAGFNRCR